MFPSLIVIPESKGIIPVPHSNDMTLFASSTTASVIVPIQNLIRPIQYNLSFTKEDKCSRRG